MEKNQASTLTLVKVGLDQNANALINALHFCKKFLFWKKKQLSKGGDQQSFAVLLDCIGGLSASDLNLMSINLEGKLHLKKN